MDTPLINSDQPDSRAPLPFAYKRNHDIRNQKVVFNPVGQYATDVSFIHAEIRMPFNHIPKIIHVAGSTTLCRGYVSPHQLRPSLVRGLELGPMHQPL